VICPGLRVPEFQTARSKQLKIHEGGDFMLDDIRFRRGEQEKRKSFAHATEVSGCGLIVFFII
jgi:hypothetical protein